MPLGAFKAALMGTAGVSAAGDVVLLHDQDYSGVTSASITSGIDSTYGEYIFKFYDLSPESDGAEFTFQVNASGESDYNETMTTTFFYAEHAEDHDSATGALTYDTGDDQAEGTNFQFLSMNVGSDADQSTAGELHLFNPSSTTYVKHFYSRMNGARFDDRTWDNFAAGYINTTTAIDDIQFKMSSGNFDGTIKMWGVK